MVADLFGKSKTQGERTTAIFSILIEPSRRAGYHKWFLTRIFPRCKSVHDRGKIIFATVVKFYDRYGRLSTRQISIARFNNINCTVIAPLSAEGLHDACKSSESISERRGKFAARTMRKRATKFQFLLGKDRKSLRFFVAQIHRDSSLQRRIPPIFKYCLF